MPDLITLVLLAVGILNVILGLFALVQNIRSLSNIFFAITAFALGGWVIGIAGFLSANDPIISLIWAKTYYFFPLLVALAILAFSYVFMAVRKPSLKRLAYLGLTFLIVVTPILVIPTFLTANISYHDWGKEVVLNRAHYLVYSAYLLSCLLGAEYIMLKKSFRLKGVYKAQARLFFYGFLITGIFGVFFNLILPWFGNYQLIWLGPLFTTAFVVAISYSIIYHKMFDMRLAAVRTTAYLLTFALITILYGALVFGLGDLFLNEGGNLTDTQRAYYVATAILTALIFQPLKHFFDKLTNSIFYRDAYDPQIFLDDLNQTLVSNIEIDTLLQKCSQVIEQNLKTAFCSFFIRDTAYYKNRMIGNSPHTLKSDEIDKIQTLIPHIHKKIIFSEEKQNTAEEKLLAKIMKANDIEILVRLVSTLDYDVAGIGYIIIGPKLSSNLYNKQDLQILEIIANEMVIAAENALRFEEIEQFNVTLQRKIDDATRQLTKSNQKLQTLDQAKDEFISMASHQLRTPLTSVKGYLSMLSEGDAGELNDTQKQFINQSYISAQRMVYLIADLLNVSRLKTGKFIIEPVKTYLPNLIEEELAQVIETARARELDIEFDKPGEFPSLMLDDTKIRQVIMNFVDNAIYYSTPGGKITVELKVSGSSVEFTVTDTGIGVPKAEQHHLFTKFYRAGNARKSRPDGTGLGLFMAKKVVIAQGGALIFKSIEGKGSTFGFSFPLRKLQVVHNEENKEASD